MGTSDQAQRVSGARGDDTLTGGGELGALMRAYDWAASPLGPVESWPRSLKTCVRILLTSRQPMWLAWGDQLTFLYNDPYRQILGGKHGWALGRPLAEVWHEVWDEVYPRLQTALSGKEGTYDEAFLFIMERHGYQEETYYTFSYSPVPNDEGGVGGIFCANTDDTRRIVGERELALLRELAASTANVRTIDDACARSADTLAMNPHDIPFAALYLVEADATGQRHAALAAATNIERGHPAAPLSIPLDGEGAGPLGTLLAEAADDANLRHIPDIRMMAGSAADIPTGAWSRPPTQAAVLPIAPSGDTGRAGLLIVGLNPYRAFDTGYRSFLGLVAGQIAAAIGSAQSYEDERRRAEMLAELDRAKTAFFSNVSHEFRTPLTLLLGPIEDSLADENHPLPAVHRERQEAARRNARRLLRLVNSLLDFSRIEAGREQVIYEATDLSAYTTDLASTFRSAVEQAGLQFIVDCPRLPTLAYIDRAMWEKVVLNLLSNALKFTFEGEIGIAVNAVRDAFRVTVWDTGVGIAPTELPRLFERFHRVQGGRARTHEGTGIGLALVQELVKLHGGSIAVESEPDRGTRFTIVLPAGDRRRAGDNSPTPVSITMARPTSSYAAPYLDEALSWLPDQPPSDSRAAAHNPDTACLVAAPGLPSQDSGRPCVLVADDNRDMREYVSRLLGQHYDVTAVGDGDAALAAAQAHPPALVLSDVMMPGLDGFELVSALRADQRTREVPVILLSARAGEEASTDGLRSGADDYLVKPFSARELLARVEARIALAAARAEAEAERARLQALFEQAPAAVCLLYGPTHVFTLANPMYRRLVGHDDLLGLSVREVFPELEGNGILAVLDRVYREGTPYVGNEMMIPGDWHQDGQPDQTYFNFVYAPVFGPGGGVEGIFVHAYEVTNQVVARQEVERLARALARERDRVEQVLTSIRDAFVTIDHDWRFTYVNDQAVNLLGVPRARLVGQRVWDLFPEAVGGTAYTQLHDAAAHRRPAHFEDYNPVLCRWYENRAYPSEGGLAVLFSDITERRLAEDRVREGEERLRVALAGAQITVFTQDRDCRYTWLYNPLPQFKPEEIVGTTDADNVAPEEAAYLHAIKRRVMETGQGTREVVKATSRAGVTYHDLIVEPLRDSDGTIIGVIGSALDVTERQMLERAQNEFIAMASHELRNPLAAVRGFAQLMQRREQYSERAVEAILGQTRQLERLIDDLLDITRASTGRLELQRADTDLLALAQNAVDEAQATTSLHRVRLRAPHRPIRGAWDADRLGQVFRNLLSNAIKYSPAGGEIVVRVRPEATAATITVIDQGQGIPEEALPRLFDRFYRVAHGAGQASGLGLGLAITKTLVEAHGGRIEVASTLGQGSTFTVHLPYDGVGEPGAPPPAAGQPTPRVLIVDDDEQIRTLLEQALLDEGYEVATAADGQEALCRVQAEPPHLILLDLIMPTMDGLEFAQQLDRQRLRGETPILIISAGDRLSQSAAQIRAAAHLAKPFDLTMLLEMVGRLMPHLAQ